MKDPIYIVVKYPLAPTYKEDKFYYVCQLNQNKDGTIKVKCGHCKRGVIRLKYDGLEGNIFCKVCDAMVVRVDMRAELGDPNYNSGHSIDVNGNCNMGCC